MLPLFPRDFIAATLGWTLDQRGLYMMLLCAQWELGSLPPDPETLANIAGVSLLDFARAWTKVGTKFPSWPDGFLRNERLEQHRSKSLKLNASRSSSGKAGGKAKAKNVANRVANGLAKSLPPSPSPSPSPEPSPIQQTKTSERAAPLVLHDSLPLEQWEEWLERRRKRRWPIDNVTLQKQLNVLKEFDAATQAAMINTSINAGWQGIFAPKGNGVTSTKKPYVPPRSVAQMEADEEAKNAQR
jgi:uncharacterized protein YdaU (DUF1376 family)